MCKCLGGLLSMSEVSTDHFNRICIRSDDILAVILHDVCQKDSELFICTLMNWHLNLKCFNAYMCCAAGSGGQWMMN